MYHCLECGSDFVHSAVFRSVDIDTGTDYIDRHVCPYCASNKYAEIKLETAKIVSVRSVDIAQVDMCLAEGYEVHELYAKTATLIKRQTPDEPEPIKTQAAFTKDDLTIHDLESMNEYVIGKTVANLEQDILKRCNGFNTVADIENLVPERQYPEIHKKLRDKFALLVAKKIIEIGDDHIPRIVVTVTKEGASPQ